MRYKLKLRLILSLTVFLTVFIVAIVATYAYFQVSEDHGITIEAGDFEVEMMVYFNGDIVTYNSPYYDPEKGVVTVNAFDATSDNYIEDLDIYFKIKPIVASRFRFKINQEWELGTYYINQNEENPIDPVIQSLYHEDNVYPYYPFSDLIFSQTFGQPLYDQEGYIYYPDIVESSADDVSIHIIDGGDAYGIRSNTVLYEECYLYFDMSLDIVQANRVSERWGIENSFFES
ncbi:MAG: hypothetical protein WCR19_03055 [Acholeplasmataceae bacterium]